jgi:hypothetical protein
MFVSETVTNNNIHNFNTQPDDNDDLFGDFNQPGNSELHQQPVMGSDPFAN